MAINRNPEILSEYTIPEKIDSQIPEYFYFAMLGELVSVFGVIIVEKQVTYKYDINCKKVLNKDGEPVIEEEYYNLDSSTAGWVEAFKETCKKLDMEFLIDYYKSLDWSHADIFNAIIESRIINRAIKKDSQEGNAYYKYLLKKNN